MSDGGKGSKPRPFSIPLNNFSENWDRIFGDKHEKHDQDKGSQASESVESRGLDLPGLHQSNRG